MNKLALLQTTLFVGFALVANMETSYCQISLAPKPDASAPSGTRLTLQNGGDNAALTVHHDSIGRPCLDIEAASRSHVVNPDVYDHVISVYNQCLTTIQLHVCYYHTDHCIEMNIPGSERKDAVLGVYPNMQYFRFSYEEKLCSGIGSCSDDLEK